MREAFGDAVFDGLNHFDRKKTADIAFRDKVFLIQLTQIIHQYIIERIYRIIDEIQQHSDSVAAIVIDAPIPVEKGFLDISDEIWSVVADYENKLTRVLERDHISKEQAVARFSSQISDEEYRRLADVVIENNGSKVELRKKVRKNWICFLKRYMMQIDESTRDGI